MERQKYSIDKRLLALLLALFMLIPTGMESVVMAAGSSSVRLTVSSEEILNAVEKGNPEAAEILRDGNADAEPDRFEGDINPGEAVELHKEAPPVVVVSEDGDVISQSVDVSESYIKTYYMDEELSEAVEMLNLPLEDEQEDGEVASVLMRREVMEALDGTWLVKAFNDLDGAQAVVAIDPASLSLVVVFVNLTDRTIGYSLSVVNSSGVELELDEVSAMIYGAVRQTLSEEELVRYSGKSEILAVTVTANVQELPEITVAAEDAELAYTGEEQEVTVGGVITGDLAEGHMAGEIVAAGRGTEPGSHAIRVESVSVVDENGTDVTALYHITLRDGTLTITDEESDVPEGTDPEEPESTDPMDPETPDEPEVTESEIEDSEEPETPEGSEEPSEQEVVDEEPPADTDDSGSDDSEDNSGNDAVEESGEMYAKVVPTLQYLTFDTPDLNSGDDSSTPEVEEEIIAVEYKAATLTERSGRSVPAGGVGIARYGIGFGPENDPDGTNAAITVTFDPDNELDDKTYEYLDAPGTVEEPAWLPQIPDGMLSFLGWFAPNAEEPFDFETTVVEEDLTLTARYSNRYLVMFKDAYGKVIDSELVEAGRRVSETAVQVAPPEDNPDQRLVHWYVEGDPDAKPYQFSDPVNENLVLRPYFSDSYYVYFFSEGTQVEPQFVPGGDTADEPDKPERAGYEFLYWSLDQYGDDREEFKFDETPITENTTLYAVWRAQETTYTVVYWMEKPNFNDDPGTTDTDLIKNYMYRQQETKKALSGETITLTADDVDALQYAEFYHSGTTVIVGNGTSVVNVYFKRKVYTLNFDLNPNVGILTYTATMTINGKTYKQTGNNQVAYTIEAKYEQDIEHVWPSLSNATFTRNTLIVTDQFKGWANTSFDNTLLVTKRFTLTTDLIDASRYSFKVNWGGGSEVPVNYWIEALPGETGELYQGKTYFNSEKHSQVYVGSGTLQPKTIEGVTHSGTDNKKDRRGNITEYNFYYTRNTFTLSFNTGTDQLDYKPKLMYEEPLAVYKPVNPTSKTADFKGWYYEAECMTPVEFEKDIMPNSNLTVFAKWESNENTVTYHDGVRGGVVHTQGVATGDFARADDEKLIEYQESGERGRFVGWYRMLNNQLAPFSFETPITMDLNLYAVWQTDGLTITYSEGEGTGSVPVDSREYDIDVLAPVLDGNDLTPPDGYDMFIGWKIGDSGATYYPGNTVRVTSDIVFVAQYALRSSTVTITYQSGYDDGPEDKVVPAKNPDNIRLPDANDFKREGYMLVGWQELEPGVDQYAPGDEYDVTDNAVFKALWEPIRYTVTFRAGNHGSLVVDSETTTDEIIITDIAPDAPWNNSWEPEPRPDENYYFTGWDESIPDKVTDNLIFTAGFAKKTPVYVTASAEKVYDGTTDLTDDQITWSTSSLPDGYELSGLTASTTQTEAGVYTQGLVIIGTPVVMYDGGNVTEQFNVEVSDGVLKISKRPLEVTVTGQTGSVVYNGQEQELTGFTFDITGTLVDDHELDVSGYRAVAKGTNPSDTAYPTEFSGEITVKNNTDNYAVTVVENAGELKINKRELIIKGKTDYQVPFDGNDHADDDILYDSYYTAEGLAEGQTVSEITVAPQSPAVMTDTYTVAFSDARIAEFTDYYDISYEPGSFRVVDRDPNQKLDWTVTGDDNAAPYDGTPHSVTTYSHNLGSGYEVEGGIAVNTTKTDAGKYDVIPQVQKKAWTIKLNGVDVTEQYNEPDVVPGTLTIHRRPVTIAGDSDYLKPFDATDHSGRIDNEYFTAGNLITDHAVENVRVIPQSPAVLPGVYDAVIDADAAVIRDVDGKDVTRNYIVSSQNGIFEIGEPGVGEEIEWTITAGSLETVYDGTEHSITTWSTSIDDLFTVTGVTVDAARTDAGETDTEPQLENLTVLYNNEDYSHLFAAPQPVNGMLKITKRDLTVTATANSGAFVFDATAKTVSGYTITSESGRVDRHTISGLDAARTETAIGVYDVEVTGEVVVLDMGRDVTENYEIALIKVPGTLEISSAQYPLMIAGRSGTYVYNGNPQTLSGYETTGLQEGHTLTGLTATAIGTDVGIYPMAVTGTALIHDAAGNDVTASYVIATRDGTLVISTKFATITADNKTKTEGQADPALTATVVGAVEGETLNYTLERTSGEAVGTYTVNVQVGDNPNYTVEAVAGVLTITADEGSGGTDPGTNPGPGGSTGGGSGGSGDDYSGPSYVVGGGGTGTVTIADGDVPLVNIGDEEVPLAGGLIDIADEAVPLGGLPGAGGVPIEGIGILGFMIVGLGGLIRLGSRKSKKDEDEQ